MLKAYAKVNLSLKVVNLLPNNYHTLEAVNVKIDLFDEIKITEADQTAVGYQNFQINKDEDTIVKVLNALKNNIKPNTNFSYSIALVLLILLYYMVFLIVLSLLICSFYVVCCCFLLGEGIT